MRPFVSHSSIIRYFPAWVFQKPANTLDTDSWRTYPGTVFSCFRLMRLSNSNIIGTMILREGGLHGTNHLMRDRYPSHSSTLLVQRMRRTQRGQCIHLIAGSPSVTVDQSKLIRPKRADNRSPAAAYRGPRYAQSAHESTAAEIWAFASQRCVVVSIMTPP